MRGEIVRRATVESIVAQRGRALELYERAHEAIAAASLAIKEATVAAAQAAPGVNSYNHHIDKVREYFLAGLKVPDRDDFMATARRLTDTDVWSHVIAITDLERLMDKKAKDQFRQQLIQDPPEATVENIAATLQHLMGDAETIFRRGIAECFSSLDRRFRSHDGWKIGSRVILNGAFDEWGSWSYYRNHRDTLQDIERTFMVLEGKPVPQTYDGIVGAVERERGKGWGRRQSEVETEYFKIRCFKNGNCHIWFKRDDLVRQVNKLLAEYYGEVIPEEREPDKDTGLNDPKTSLAKNCGFFPTPEAAAHTLIEGCPLHRREGEPRITVLEPSAGTGNLASLAAAKGAAVDCVEIQPALAMQLRAAGRYRAVIQTDFLALRPDPAKLYDCVIMNPPFDRERDIDHVMHALKFLKPSGHLAAIMSAGTEYRETRKAQAFRDMMGKLGARWRDLPAGSFASVGTNVNTIILHVYKDGRTFYR